MATEYVVQEEDGTSKFTLEEGGGSLLLEESTGGGGGGTGMSFTMILHHFHSHGVQQDEPAHTEHQ